MNDTPPRVSRWAAAVSVLLAALVIVSPFAFGAFFIAVGVGWIPHKAGPPGSMWVTIAVGLMFVLAGVAVAWRKSAGRSRDVLGALIATLFAFVFGWVALGPGERAFSTSMSAGAVATHGSSGELTGRIVFGIGAALMGVFALYIWKRVFFPANPLTPDTNDAE